MKTLVIVESPTKAKTISKFLGRNFIVKSSFGHVRDLPKSKLGVDVEDNFEPTYVVSTDKKEVVKELTEAAKKSDIVLFATDEDREGEAISFHLSALLGIEPTDAKRVTFHEITKDAIVKAFEHPRALDIKLVDAQQARRVLDRLVGYELSPFLWRKVAKGLSAGRVQSVAVRLVVEREREIRAFIPQEYWSIEGLFSPKSKEEFAAKLTSIAGKKLDKFDIKNQTEADTIVAALKGQTYSVTSVEQKNTSRAPNAPFTTSSLQQEANNQLGYSAKLTMRIAQKLYEGVELGSEGHIGLITYMRTDAVNLSDNFLNDAAAVVLEDFGKEYALPEPRRFKNKSKNAQEAHEAIRPTDAKRTPALVKPFLAPQEFRLYELIWKRAVATQMADAKLLNQSVDLMSANNYGFRATGQTIVFDGFLKLFPEKSKENLLPPLTEGEAVTCTKLTPEQHFTEPPARYSDATLVKALEEYGIGRPSTYAPTIATIEDRGYVVRDEKKRLGPTDIAYIVNDVLVEHFPHVVDFQFTANMEQELDDIAEGTKEWRPVIKAFYVPFHDNLKKKEKEIDKKELTEIPTDEVCDKCGKPMVAKTGRFGRFLACTGYPECKSTKPLDAALGKTTPEMELTDVVCEKCGSKMQVKHGRFGPFLGCSNYPDCKNIKPIEKKIGVKCPVCKEGDLIERKTKRGRFFYGCNRYPKCEAAFWEKPNGESCPKCKSPLTQNAKGVVKCSNKECDYKKEVESES